MKFVRRFFFHLLLVVLLLVAAGAVAHVPAQKGARAPAASAADDMRPRDGKRELATHAGKVNFTELARRERDAAPPPTEDTFLTLETDDEFGDGAASERLPDNLPISTARLVKSVAARALAATATPATTATQLPPSPAPASSFLGSEDNLSSIPPDTDGAVGPNHIMVALNGRVRILRRDGQTISTVGLTQFWRSANSNFTFNKGAFDPRVLYDHAANRWILTSCADSRTASSSILVGVSQTSDPTGNWNVYQIDADPADVLWADYPSVGLNKNWIVVQVNMFPVTDGTGSFTSNILVFNKADLYAGGAGQLTRINAAGLGGTQSPAVTFDDALPTIYLVNNWNSGAGVLQLFQITGAVGAESLSQLSQIVGAAGGWSGGVQEDFAPQLGATRKIQNNDARLQNVVYRGGSLWCAQTVFLPAGGAPTRSAIQWEELNPANGAIVQSGRIDDASGAAFFAFPSIAVNKNKDVLIGYTRFSATQHASANYSFRAGTDPPGTLRDEVVLKAGEGPYDKDLGSGRNRWGDYSATVVDPSNDTEMWTLQQYAAASSASDPNNQSRWGVWWGRVGLNATPAPTPVPLPDSTVQFGAAAITVDESAAKVSIPVTRAGNLSGAMAVNYATADGTASGRSDYTTALGTLRFAPNEATKAIDILLIDDAFAEQPETFTVTLSNPTGGALGGQSTITITLTSNDAASGTNPIRPATFVASFFVRQHYIDFFNREPDAAGLSFWANQITECLNSATLCDAEVRKTNVSAAFFLSIEFQQTGYLVYRFHQAAFNTGERLPLRIFLPDTQEIGRGVVVGAPGWEAQLEANKQAFADAFVARPEFVAAYPIGITASDFVNRLNAGTGNSLTAAESNALAADLSSGARTRSQVLRAVAENAAFTARERNRAFVLMQYFGYLRRNPNEVPNTDFSGYNFWLGKLNEFNGNFVNAEMVKAFITSGEYQQRFGP